MKSNLAYVLILAGLCAASASTCLGDATGYVEKTANGTVTLPHRMTATHIVYQPPVAAPPEILLVAQFAKPIVAAGDSVLLQATMQNDSKQSIVMQENGDGWLDFSISVTGPSGKEAPLTAWGKEQQQRADQNAHPDAILMNVQRPLAPGQKVTYQFVLNRQFDMSNVGQYHVVVTQPGIILPGNQKTLPIVSNAVDVQLVEPVPAIENPQNLGN